MTPHLRNTRFGCLQWKWSGHQCRRQPLRTIHSCTGMQNSKLYCPVQYCTLFVLHCSGDGQSFRTVQYFKVLHRTNLSCVMSCHDVLFRPFLIVSSIIIISYPVLMQYIIVYILMGKEWPWRPQLGTLTGNSATAPAPLSSSSSSSSSSATTHETEYRSATVLATLQDRRRILTSLADITLTL